MISRFRLSSSAMVVATLVVLAALIGLNRASAQIVFTPPCGAITINNTTNCQAQLRLRTNPAGALPAVILVPAGGAVVVPVGVPNLTIGGVFSIGGNFYPAVVPPPPGGCTCLPGDWHTCCVTLNPALGCCFDVCYNPAACLITLRPALCGVCRP